MRFSFHARWRSAHSDDCLITYSAHHEFLALDMWLDVLACNDPNCDNSQQKFQLTVLFNSMKESMHLASENLTKNERENEKGTANQCIPMHVKTLCSGTKVGV